MKEILVFGGTGLVGSKFIDLHGKSFNIKAPNVSELDILNKEAVRRVFKEFNPDTIINFAAFTDVEAAQDQKGDKKGICYLINVVGAKNVAEVCKQFGKRLIHISTEYVFDGTKKESPYTEDDKPNPINWYGETKYLAEQAVAESGCSAVVMRICMPFSPLYELKKDVARFFLEQLRAGNPIRVVEDQRITPTIVSDIANALGTLLNANVSGTYHISSTNHTSPIEFANLIASVFGIEDYQIDNVLLDEYNKDKKAKLLRYSWLSPAKFEGEFGRGILHSIEEAVRLFKSQIDLKGQS